MTHPRIEHLFEAFFRWAFEVPPLARSPQHITNAVAFPPHSLYPMAILDDEAYPVVGIMQSGWMSVADAGWVLFSGDADDIPGIATACNRAQQRLLDDYAAYEAALTRHMAAPHLDHIGGLPVTTLSDGLRAVRIDDINVPEVRAALDRHIAAHGPHLIHDLEDDLPVSPSPAGFIYADSWWRWCRVWAELPPQR